MVLVVGSGLVLGSIFLFLLKVVVLLVWCG